MPAARGKPEDRVARPDRAAIDNALLLHHADAEARQVVFAFRIHSGHLGGLAADQRAARELAAARNTLDDFRGDALVKLAAGEIVEKEKGLCALHQNSLDAHPPPPAPDPAFP